MMKLSSENPSIQKNIARLLTLIAKLKDRGLLGEEYKDNTDYYKIHRHSVCHPKIRADIKRLLGTDILNDDSSSQNMPTILANLYSQDWSFVQNSEKLFSKFFILQEKFFAKQVILINQEYATKYPEENSELIKSHLLSINLSMRHFFSKINNRNGVSIIEKICHVLKTFVENSTYETVLTSDFMENTCNKQKVST
ncbi:hypothetical protein HZS_6437 [Henneguya salminicola]|nr:hypothetical protein HZS_6437 [Henneguya salminicola]